VIEELMRGGALLDLVLASKEDLVGSAKVRAVLLQ